jgi:acetyltransferase-like isoleucine patch superfamily enzyme
VGGSSILLKGSIVGAGAILGAGSVLRGVVPEGQIWAGNPARLLRRGDAHAPLRQPRIEPAEAAS